jgi:phosphate/sulfate permease
MNLFNLLGIDREILLLCSAKEQKLYHLFTYLQLGLIVVVGFSWYYIIDVIFDNTFVSIVLGIFLAFIFFNLYRFVLLTVSGKRAKTKKEKASIILPNLFKISAIAIFAVFISFPIKLFVHKSYIEENLPDVLSKKIEEVKLEIDGIYQTKEKELLSRVNYYQSQLDRLESDIKEQNEKLKNPDYKISENQIRKHLINLNSDLALKRHKFTPIINEKKDVIAGLNSEKQKEVEQYERIIKNSNLLIERFALLFSQKPVTESILTLFIILLFLSPLMFKLISIYYHNFKYEKFNTEKMRQEIVYNYENFKQSYREITSAIGEEKEFLELYDDAPFNTIKKTDKRKKDKKGSFSSFLIQTHQ